MSGIAAVLSLDGSAIAQADIERLANVLKPYGPNRQKIMTRGNAAFVFCLHKLTPEDTFDSQPLILANRLVMLFDGRIDNRSELGEMLGISTTELNLMSDSRIALRLFDRWGERAFERIVGVFAIIVVDLQNNSLLCARDHLGLRVLHYHRSSTRFAVASAPEALFALSWIQRVLSKEQFADTLTCRWPSRYGESTCYKDISRVCPGYIVQVRGKNFSKRQFWDPESIRDVRFGSDQDYVDAFKERLDDAVRANLRSSAPPCAMITGGLDSSSIAVVAADIMGPSGNRLNTFTAVPGAGFSREELPGRYFDERPYVEQIAALNKNIAPHFITQSSDTIPGKIAKITRMSGLISSTLNALWLVDLFAAARAAGHNVMLGGDTGNVTMSYHGYGLFTELVLTGRWLQLFTEIRHSGYRWRRHVRQKVLRPLIPNPLFRRYKQWRRGPTPPWHDYSFIHPEFAARSQVIERAARENEPIDSPPLRNTKLGRIRDFQMYAELADWYAKVRANYGIDIRSPAFDRRLVEFCIGIPTDQYLRGGRDRWLIRRAMEGRLPPMVVKQTKVGAQAADWYPRLTQDRSRIAEEVKRLTANPEVASILDLQRFNGILENWPDHQPPEYTAQEGHILAIPDALGAAYFIEETMGVNYTLLRAGNSAD
jgi:asparagine synthase (glutamine-hydrolysing)